jgi:AcrR family transcriptional regulator
MTVRVTVRQEERRRVILASARQLLRDRGWHAVAIDEIGAASGLTGPAVYRYFESKQALLTTALSHAAEELWSSLPDTAHPDTDHPDLAALVDSHVRFVLGNVDLVELWYGEARHLPTGEWHEQRRLQRRYIEHWVAAVLSYRPDIDREQAQVMARGAIGLIHSVAHVEGRQDPDVVGPILVAMAMAALEATPAEGRGA